MAIQDGIYLLDLSEAIGSGDYNIPTPVEQYKQLILRTDH